MKEQVKIIKPEEARLGFLKKLASDATVGAVIYALGHLIIKNIKERKL